MEDNKKINTDRQKAKELTEKLKEGMDGLCSSMETMRRNVEDFISGMEYAIRSLQEEWESESDKAMDSQKEDEPEKTYQEVEVFGIPALFDNARILPEDVPEGLLLYDLRGSDYDPGEPVTVERHVVVNHAASILMAVPLPVPEQGALWLGEKLNFVGGMITVREFMEEHSGIVQMIAGAGIDGLARDGYMVHIFQDGSALDTAEFNAVLNSGTGLPQYAEFTHSNSAISGFMLTLQNVFTGLLLAFALILVVVSLIVMGHSIGSAMEQDRTDTGILKTIGFTTAVL